MALIAQAELVGDPRRHYIHVEKAGKDIRVSHLILLRVIAFLDETTGEMGFRPIKNLPYAPDSLPHIPLQGHIFDSAWQNPSLINARKKGASAPYVDTNAAYVKRGGTLKRPAKTGGFTFTTTAGEIAEERERKKIEEAYGPEVAATQISKYKGPPKTGGFRPGGETVRRLEKERRRKMEDARKLAWQMENQYLEFP